jgi:hypothetical protein
MTSILAAPEKKEGANMLRRSTTLCVWLVAIGTAHAAPRACDPATRPAACPGGGGPQCNDGAWSCAGPPSRPLRDDEASILKAPGAPNAYDCTGKGVEVHYTTTSFQGKPTFVLREKGREVTKDGGSITVENTTIGVLLTIVTEHLPDQATTTASLLVPPIRLGEKLKEATFKTSLIHAAKKTSLLGAEGIEGPRFTTVWESVDCVAKRRTY